MTSAAVRRRRRARPRPADPAGRVVRFCERHLRHSQGEFAGEPFLLERWQREEIIEPLFGTLDRNNWRTYREALIGIPRGDGKSPLAAAMALYGLYADHELGAEVYSLAASRPQARIVFGNARNMVLASPLLRAASRVYKDAIEVPETGSVYRVLSSDASLAHGYNPHLVIVDELHVHKKPDLYEAMRSALHKRRQPLLVSITTAGWDRETLCYRLYERGRDGNDPRFFFRWWAAPDGCKLTDTKAWRQANPASWISIASLRDQLRAMPEPVFRRLHLNQWTSSEATWIPMQLWDACDAAPKIPLDAPVYIGVDAAPKKDTTAVVIVHRDDTGVHHWKVRIFKADRIMGYLDFLEVEDYLRELCGVFDVRRIVVDPFTMMRSLVILSEEGLPVEEYPQNDARMVPASQTLYDLVQEGRLRHGGDEIVRAQAAVAVARETARGWRLHKLRSAAPIDAIVAGAMASHVAEQEWTREGGGGVFSFDESDFGDDDGLDLDDLDG